MRAPGLLMVLVLLGAAPLRADSRDKHAAASHFQQGSALYAEGRWSEALSEFQAGYESYPLRGFLVNIGQCYRKLERLDEAADSWRRFLATHPPDSRLRTEVEEALSEVAAARSEPTEPPKTEAPSQPAPPEAAPPNLAPTPPVEEPPPAEQALRMKQPEPAPIKKKSRAWVWALVTVAAASVTAAAVTAGVVEWQASTPRGGSLGLIDGRR